MNYCKSILICGGDKRQIYMYKMMLAEGLNVSTCALGTSGDVPISSAGNYDVVVFPVPVSTDGVFLNAPLSEGEIKLDDIFHNMAAYQTVLGGMCKGHNYNMTDYYDSERVKMRNAIPTAEGALRIAMENCDFTISGSRCLVVGFGRIGKVISKRLHDMGAEVCIAARKESDRTLAEVMGAKTADFRALPDIINTYDIIFNTVPKTVIDSEMLGKIGKSVLMIDLASRPYGIDMTAARALGRRVIIASGLPGKFSPKSSAKILKDAVTDILYEMEV